MLDITISITGHEVAAITAINDMTGTAQFGNYSVAYWQSHEDGTMGNGRFTFARWERSRSALEFARELIDEIVLLEAEKKILNDA